MDTTTKPKLHPVIWVAAVSVIVLSLAGVGAITGVIPTVGSRSADPAALQAANAPAQAASVAAPVAALAIPPEPAAAPAETVKAVASHSEKKHAAQAAVEPARLPPPTLAQASPSPQAAPAPIVPPICKECGTIEAVRQIEVKGEGTGLGAVGGAVVGGLLGSNIGGGNGKSAMAVLGAVGGGLAGNQIEKNARKQVRYQVSVRFDDDTARTFTQDQQPTWRNGDRVRIVDGQITLLR
jgi:outer membrane lipoprotein SlyB